MERRHYTNQLKPAPMKLITIQVLFFSLFFLLLFALTFNLDFTGYLQQVLNRNTFTAAGISTLVLAADIVLPVPSSMVMLLNGKLFGIVNGTLISCCGLLLSTIAGYAIGRGLKRRLSFFVSIGQQEEAARLFKRWGYLILILSRPVPLLSESLSIVAGVQKMPFWAVLLSAITGSLPGAYVYAYYGFRSNAHQNEYLSFFLVMGIATLAFLIARLFNKFFNTQKHELL